MTDAPDPPAGRWPAPANAVTDPKMRDLVAGWYALDGGGTGYWDGGRWVSAVPPREQPQLGVIDIIGGVCIGVLLAWVLIWAAARWVSDDIFFPVKVVVDQQELDQLEQSLRP